MLLTLEVTYRLESKINLILEGTGKSLAKTMGLMEIVDGYRNSRGKGEVRANVSSPLLGI